MNDNITFSRLELKETLKQVQETFDMLADKNPLKANTENREAWVIKTGNLWEFHYKGFYYSMQADSAYDARSKGWEDWMRHLEHKFTKWSQKRKTGE